MSEFIEYIERFIFMQAGLWKQLSTDIKDDIDPLLLNVPKYGVLHFEGEDWVYRKHGLGVRFVNGNKCIVDSHDIRAGSQQFSEWGIFIYFDSLKRKGDKYFTINHTEMTEDQIHKNLEILSRTGFILKKDKGYVILGHTRNIGD